MIITHVVAVTIAVRAVDNQISIKQHYSDGVCKVIVYILATSSSLCVCV